MAGLGRDRQTATYITAYLGVENRAPSLHIQCFVFSFSVKECWAEILWGENEGWHDMHDVLQGPFNPEN